MRRHVTLATLSLLNFLLMALTFNSLGQALPFMVPDLGMDWATAGFGFTLLGLACGLASTAPARTARAIGMAWTFAIGAMLLGLGFAAFASARGSVAYDVGAVLLGLGYCFGGPVPAVDVVGRLYVRRSTAIGIYFTAGNLGAVGGPLLFYAASETGGGWRGYWWLCAIAALGVGLAAAAAVRGRGAADTADDPAPSAGVTARRALRTPQYWVVVAAYTGGLLVNTTVHGFAFQHLMDAGLSKARATALISLFALIAAGAAVLAGLIGERVSARALTATSLVALAIATLALAYPGAPGALGAFVVGTGIGLGFTLVGTAGLLQRWFGQRANLELYSIMALVSTVAAAGPALGGVVRDRTGSFADVFLALTAISAALLVALYAVRAPAVRTGR